MAKPQGTWPPGGHFLPFPIPTGDDRMEVFSEKRSMRTYAAGAPDTSCG